MLVLHFTFFIFSMMLKYEVSIKTIEEIFKKKEGILYPLFFDILPLMRNKKLSQTLYKSKQIELHTCIEKSLVGFRIPVGHHCQWNFIFHYL